MDLKTTPTLNPPGQRRSLQETADPAGAMDANSPMREQHPLRVMVFLEASTIAGAVKPILEFAREAANSATGPAIELAMVLYRRVGQESSLTDVVRNQGVAVEVIEERHAFDLRVLPQLRELTQKLRPDIIWTNNTKSHFLVSLGGLHRTAEWIAFHHGYTKEAWRTNIYNELDRWSLPRAKRVVTVCHDFAKQLQRKGVRPGQIRVVRNPIRVSPPVTDSEKTHLRSELGLNNTSVLLTVGRLSFEKGHADLLRALAHMRAAQDAAFRSRLLIVGDGPERHKLHTICSQLKLDDVVRFTGFQSDVRPYYGISDIFILPSHSEGSPNVLLEAMAAGLPIVATSVGGLPEVLSHEVNALLVPKQNIAELANAITTLLDNPLLRQQLSDRGKEVIAQHDPQSYFRNVVGLFEEVMREAAA